MSAAAAAPDLTAAIANIKDKVSSANEERKQLAAALRTIISQAQAQLAELEGTSVAPRRGRPAGSGKKRGRPAAKAVKTKGKRRGRRKFTAAQKAEQSRKMKAAWAKRKAAGK